MNILVIDMCWNFTSDVGPTVNAPANATMANALAEASSAKPQYGGQGEFMSPSIVYLSLGLLPSACGTRGLGIASSALGRWIQGNCSSHFGSLGLPW
jgi:hypothetical protein